MAVDRAKVDAVRQAMREDREASITYWRSHWHWEVLLFLREAGGGVVLGVLLGLAAVDWALANLAQ